MEIFEKIYKLPKEFSNSQEEYRALREGVGYLPLTCLDQLKVSGNDRTRFNHAMLTQDIKSLKPFYAAFSCATDNKGKMVSHMIAANLGDYFLFLCAPETGESLTNHLTKHVVADDVLIEKSSRGGFLTGAFLMIGAHAKEKVDLLRSEERLIFHLKNSLGDLFLIGTPLKENAIPDEQTERELSRVAIKIGFTAFNRYRIECGFPLFWIDMGTDTVPVEAGLTCSFSLTKGCYLGQETIAMMTHRGHPAKRLMKLSIGGRDIDIPHEHHVFSGEEEAGYITSSVFLPESGDTMMLGFVKWRFLESKLSLKVDEENIDLEILSPVQTAQSA